MTKFKPGDEVILITGKGPVRTLRDVPARWAKHAWAHDSDRIWFEDNDCWGYAKIYMLAPKSQEVTDNADLPPAPESVRYYPDSADKFVHITVEQYKDRAGSFVAVDSVYNGSIVSQYLEPDTALQLAHDLMRMALKLKREQENKV